MLGEEAESFRVRVAEGDLAELRTRAMQPSGTSSGETMDLDSFLEAGGDVLSEETTRDERPESVRSSSESFPTYSMLSVRHPWFASEEDRPRPNHNRTPPITGRPPAIGSSSRTHDQAIIEQIRERARNSLRERARNSFGLPAADRTRELEHLHNRRRANNGHLGRRTSYVDGYGARRLVDGLGDRERSLSPEGDNVWYTLQSTLTPDPQPPSVGSSFASTSVSAATSQSAPMDSSSNTTSNTAATSPEAVEPPCDPVNENSAVDDEESQSHLDSTSDHQHQRSQQLSRPQNRSSPARRSYAQVASQRGSSDAQEPDATMAENEAWRSGLMEGLTAPPGMPNSWWTQFGLSRRDSISHQPTLRSIFTHEDGNISRVVRNLAARQDIPDSWWARYGIERQTARDQQH
ncbi:hypothetical protein F4778DRAFT_724193 [Xylariomycetidae sp. FL2044]|nr:hypothetical protein F4778DRAFT_724193 [Xylariomycetidae sp. FL2044]